MATFEIELPSPYSRRDCGDFGLFQSLSQTILGLGYIHTEDVTAGASLIDRLREFDQIALCERSFFDPAKRRARGHWTSECRSLY
jgi:hypothetical protein